jgi:hypothetical protein
MGAEKGGAHGNAIGFAQATRHTQLLALMVEREPVAGFDLNSADALSQQLFEPTGCRCEQCVFIGLTGGAH